jgi:hypothetical protein
MPNAIPVIPKVEVVKQKADAVKKKSFPLFGQPAKPK